MAGPRTSIFFIFLLAFSLILTAVFDAYSVYISLQETSIQPLPRRQSMTYFLSKVYPSPSASWYAEVRGVALSTSGGAVISAQVTWYRRFPRWFGWFVTIRVEVVDDLGSTISSGWTVPQCYTGVDTRMDSIDLSPDVSIDEVAGVEASIIIGEPCGIEPPQPLEEPILEELEEGQA